ncbi:MAG: Crp/Fnr family transcriptional regulator [Flavobacteriales bacterium]|nr:Crp/Fnr family transcriptional regulator [Flavobacteriales bacterium]
MAISPAPRFQDLELQRDFDRVGVHRIFPAGSVLMNPGDPITHIPIVLKGTIRILLQNNDGAERYLYHIFPGESCAMSLICCRTQRGSEVKAVIEDDAEIIMIPVDQMDAWMKFPEWRAFVADTQSQRFSELLESVELIAFSRMDEQLWNYLVKRVQATGTNTLHLTHQEIANELGSPREVITRLLHQLQERGRLQLARNTIEVRPLAA